MDRRRVWSTAAGIGAVIILLGVALAAASRAGGASPPPQGPGANAGPGMMMPALMPHMLLGRMADELALSPEQRQTIKGLYDQAKPGFERLHKQMRVNFELLMRTRPDDSAYQSVVANVSQAAAEFSSQFVLQASQLRSQVHGVLTADQKTQLATLEADMQNRIEQHHGHGPWGGPPPDGGPQRPQ